MLNQQVSICDIDRPDTTSTALSPLPSCDDVRVIDPELKARLIRAAAASALPSPYVIPSAAVLLHPIDLPIASDRKRDAAAPFAMEPFLATRLEDTHFAVGPTLVGTIRLCAAIDVKALQDHMASAPATGIVLPDLCGVPLPSVDGVWAVWVGQNATYLRTFDGGGFVLDTHSLVDLWRAFDRPPLEVHHGSLPPGMGTAKHIRDTPAVSPSVFELDLRPATQTPWDLWHRRWKFALGVSVIATLAHVAVLYTDARALERATSERSAAFVAATEARGLRIDLSQSTPVLTAQLERRANAQKANDGFLSLLARTGTALIGRDRIDFRDMRFDASAGTLSILISAPDLAALQQIESALQASGMTVTTGAASTGAAGAEMQLVVSEFR